MAEAFDKGPFSSQEMEVGHFMGHHAPHDFDNVTLLSCTERDLWILAMSLAFFCEHLPCLAPASIDLQKRIAEVMNAQDAIERGRETWAPPEEEEDELPDW